MFGVLRPRSPERERMPVPGTASPPPPRSLAPMPSNVFSNREELLEGCKVWSATQGYAIVIARSRFNRLWLKCDRGGTYENRRNLTPDQRKRKRGDSRLLGCPFKMIAACRKDGSWNVDTEVPDHNHEPSDDLSAHPTLRRMTDHQLQKVHEMCDAGKSPADTLEQLRRLWPDIKVLTRDIYNARKKYKTQKEESEAVGGQPQEQPYQDPNELGFPGPNQKGRWAWVPDGEEVTDKKSKRKRKSAPATQPILHSTLDPQLQTPETFRTSKQPASTSQTSQNGFGDPQDPATQLHAAAQRGYGRFDPATSDLQRAPLTNGNDHRPSYYQNHDGSSVALSPYPLPPNSDRQFDISPLQSRAPPNAAPTATMSATPTTADANALISNPEEPKTQVLMSRIEQMEKEQRDQKNMLTQILGAVQTFRGSPSSEARA